MSFRIQRQEGRMTTTISVDQLDNYIDQEVGLSDWLEIDRHRIDKFAEAIGDDQYVHVDTERPAQTPFGTTIAHGFLILSLISMLSAKAVASGLRIPQCL